MSTCTVARQDYSATSIITLHKMWLLWAAIFIPKVNLLIKEKERARQERERKRLPTHKYIIILKEKSRVLCQQTEVSLLHQECLEEKLKPVGRKSCLVCRVLKVWCACLWVYEHSIPSVALCAMRLVSHCLPLSLSFLSNSCLSSLSCQGCFW